MLFECPSGALAKELVRTGPLPTGIWQESPKALFEAKDIFVEHVRCDV